MDSNDANDFMKEAINLSFTGMENGDGGPFGAVVVQNNRVIGRGNNRVTISQDPTAHAEINAIRDACKNIGSFQLGDCILFTSCEPCPMCLGAIYWARIQKVFFGCTRNDAAQIDFDDAFIYEEMNKPITDRKIEMKQICREHALESFTEWNNKADKTRY